MSRLIIQDMLNKFNICKLRRRSGTPDQTEIRAQDVLASDASKPIPLLGTRTEIKRGKGDGVRFSRGPQINLPANLHLN